MSNDYQLNQIRELLAELPGDSEIAVKIKEVIESNPIEKLVKKWESKLKDIKDEQEKKIVAILLENTYLNFKEKESVFKKQLKEQHDKKIKELEGKLQDASALMTTEDSIITILEGQLDLLKKQEPSSVDSESFAWRYVNPYDEVLKFWDCLLAARSVFGIQSLSSPMGIAYALRFQPTDKHEVGLTIKQKAMGLESIKTDLNDNSKVSGEQLAKNLENTLFKSLFDFLKEKKGILGFPVTNNTILSNAEKIAHKTKMGPGNLIIANESFFDEYDEIPCTLLKVVSNVIPNEHYIIGHKGNKESSAGVQIGIYQVFLQGIPIASMDSFKPQHSYITRFFFCTDIEGTEDFYQLCKVPVKIQEMVSEQKNSTGKLALKYKESAELIENSNVDFEETKPDPREQEKYRMDLKEQFQEMDEEKRLRTPEEQAKINEIAINFEKEQKDAEKRSEIVTEERLERIRKTLAKVKTRPLAICKQLWELLSTGGISHDEHKELFKEFLPDHYEVGKYTTGDILA